MKKLVVLHVDEQKLEEEGYTFEGEMGWVEQSGISLEKDLGSYKAHIRMEINLLNELKTALQFVETTLCDLPDGEAIQEDIDRIQDRLQEIEEEIEEYNKYLNQEQ